MFTTSKLYCFNDLIIGFTEDEKTTKYVSDLGITDPFIITLYKKYSYVLIYGNSHETISKNSSYLMLYRYNVFFENPNIFYDLGNYFNIININFLKKIEELKEKNAEITSMYIIISKSNNHKKFIAETTIKGRDLYLSNTYEYNANGVPLTEFH